jgi:hypothetical protein
VSKVKQEHIDVLEETLEQLLPFIGYAECHGMKCRLPHCHSCSFDAEDNAERLDAILYLANKLLGKIK